MIRKIVSLLVFSTFFLMPILAQESIADMAPEDYVNLKLPPLDSLFENAKKNPLIQIHDTKKEEEISLLKKEKRSWLKYFSVGGGYNYGILGNTSSYSDSATPLYSQYSQNAQISYHIGGSISIPIEDLFDLKPKVNRQKLRLKEIDLEKEQTMDELKQKIIELYTSILSSLSILKLKAEAMAFATAQYQIGERDFINGKGTPTSLNNQKEMQVKAITEYETIRASLNCALLKMELLTRTPIINLNKIK